MLVARYPLPTAPTLPAPEKLGPVVVALPLGDAVIAVFAANTQPMTLARFAPGAEPLVREYPAVDYLAFLDEHGDAIDARVKAGDFDASNDVRSRVPAGYPRQLVAVAGAPWLVRAEGHARLDPETLEVTPIPRSCVRWIAPLPGDEIVAGSGAEYSGSVAFQRLRRGPSALLDGPILRSRTGLTRNSDWVLEGKTFPAGDPATAFTDSLRAVHPSGASDFHAFSAEAHGGELLVYGRELFRSGSTRPGLVAIDLATEKVTRRVPVKHEDPLRLAVTVGGVLGLGDKSIVRIDPASLAIVDSAELPSGVRLLGHDARRLVALHKRSKALFVLDAEVFAGPLAAAVEALAAVVAAKPDKAATPGKARK